jgi:hypothetical protein
MIHIYISFVCCSAAAFNSFDKRHPLCPSRHFVIQDNTSITAPEEKLNEIYITILKNSVSDKYSDQEKEELSNVLKAILGTIVILFSSLPAVSLARLLHIPIEDINQTLDDLYSILEVPKDQNHPIRLHHPSFRDFLLDKQRCRGRKKDYNLYLR